jgi:hypothetical protein
MKVWMAWAALTALCVASLAQAQPANPPTQRFTAPVNLSSTDGLQRLVLPLPVMQASRSAGYADVQLLGADGQPLPMAWAQAQPIAPAQQRSVALPRFAWPQAAESAKASESTRIRVDANGAVVEVQTSAPAAKPAATSARSARWLLDLSQSRVDKEQLERISLNWPPRPEGVSMQVQVEASDDAVAWQAVTTAALLELPGGQPDAVQLKHVQWPRSTAANTAPKYLRLTFDAPMELSDAQALWQQAQAPVPQPSEVFDFAPAAATPEAPASWQLDLGGRLPLTRIEVQGSAPNTVVAWRLEQRDSATQAWQPVTSFVAWRLSKGNTEQQSAAVELPPSTARHWRLVADARTSKPGAAPLKARLWWQPTQIVFAASSPQGLRLQMGDAKASSSAVPLATLMPGYKSGDEHQLPLANVGTLTATPWQEPTLIEQLTAPNSPQRKQWLLWGVLILVVLGLGVLAMKLAKEMKSTPGPQ